MIQRLKFFKELSTRTVLTAIALFATTVAPGSVRAAAPLYEVNNDSSNSSLPNSFPAALAYVNANGGNVTFGPEAYGQTCVLGSSSFVSLMHPITINLAGLNLTGFSIDGNLSQGSSYGIQAYAPTPVGLTFTSSSQNGSFIFKNGGYFVNFGFGTMTTTLEIGTALSLISSSIFKNSVSGTDMTTNLYGALTLSDGSIFQNSGSGSMTTTVQSGATLSLAGGGLFWNYLGTSMDTTVQSGATLSLAGGSSFQNHFSGTSMTTTVEPDATLSLAEGSQFNNVGSGAGTLTSAGLISMDTGAGFYGYNTAMSVLITGGGTFASGTGGASFYGANLILSSGATHQAAIGMGSQPVQMLTRTDAFPPLHSTATLGATILNVVSPQNLPSLLGNTYPILTADPGNSILGQYGTQQFNGSSIYLPYELDYHSNSSSVTSVNVVFPPANVVRNSASNPLVPHSFAAALAYVDGLGGTPNITFGLGAAGQTCRAGHWLSVTNPISIDLAGLNPLGFSINAEGTGYGILAGGPNPASLTFVSSSGTGNFFFLNISKFLSESFSTMTTTVKTGARLTVSDESGFVNTGTGAMITTVSQNGSLALSVNSVFLNRGTAMTTNVNGLLSLSDGSYFVNDYGASGAMSTTIGPGATATLSGSSFMNHGTNMTTDVYGSLTLSSSAVQNAGSGAIITTVKPGGMLTISTNSNFYNYASGTDMITNVNGTLGVLGSSGFTSHGSGSMTTTISANGTLALSAGGSFQNYGTNMATDVYGALALSNISLFQNLGSGPMATNVYGALSLSGNSYFYNVVSGTMITNVYGALTLAGGSSLQNYGSVYGPMNTDVYGSLALSDGSSFSNPFSGVATIHSGGLLSMDTEAYFHGEDVVVHDGGTFASGARGASFGSVSFALSSTAIHQAMIGTGSQPVQLGMWAYNLKNSTATLGGATLNVVSPQSLDSLLGNTYPLLTADPGSSILGSYGVQKFNGSSLYCPYELDYHPNSSAVTSVNAVFPPANMVRNNAAEPLISHSFPAALAYVEANGGNITFSPRASGQTCVLEDVSYITHPIIFDLSGLNSVGFAIAGGSGDGYSLQTIGSNTASLIFASASGNGKFSFIDGSRLTNYGSDAQTTSIARGAALFLFNHSYVANYGTSMFTNVSGALALSSNSYFYNGGSGSMTTTVGRGAMLTLSTECRFQNQQGTDMTTDVHGALTVLGHSGFLHYGSGAMTTNIYGSLIMSDSSAFQGWHGNMITNVYGALTFLPGSSFQNQGSDMMTTNVYGTLTLGGALLNYASEAAIATIHSGGLISMDRESAFAGGNMTIAGGGIFASGIGGALFYTADLTLSPYATHQAILGTGSQPIRLGMWYNLKNSTATLGGATLNVVSFQTLAALQGNNYTLWTADSGSSIIGQYGIQKFNGSSTNLPYQLYYLPNDSVTESVIVGFPAATPVPTRVPTLQPTTKAPTSSPSLFPTNFPSAIMATLVPTATRLIANLTNVTNSSLLANLTSNFTNGTAPLGPPAGDVGESWENTPYIIGPIVAAAALTIGAVGYKVGKCLGWWGKEDVTCTSCRKQSRKTNDTDLEGSLASSGSAASFSRSASLDHSEGSLSVNSEKREFHAMAHPLEPQDEWGKISQSQGPLTRAENNSISLQKPGETVELSVLEVQPPIVRGHDPQTPQSSFRAAQIYRAEGELPPLVPLRPLGLGRPEYNSDLVPGF